MRIGAWLRQIGPEGVDGILARKYDTLAREPISMAHYRSVAGEIARRVQSGRILEIGPGPGYISIEVAKLLSRAETVGLDVSRTMVEIATRNAVDAGVDDRVAFQLGNASQMPFPARSFDFVVSSGSLHHWKEPIRIFDEVHRVLKGGGEAFVGDLRRDAPEKFRDEMAAGIDSRLMRWGLRHSFGDAHTKDELLETLARTRFSDYEVVEDGPNLAISLKKR